MQTPPTPCGRTGWRRGGRWLLTVGTAASELALSWTAGEATGTAGPGHTTAHRCVSDRKACREPHGSPWRSLSSRHMTCPKEGLTGRSHDGGLRTAQNFDTDAMERLRPYREAGFPLAKDVQLADNVGRLRCTLRIRMLAVAADDAAEPSACRIVRGTLRVAVPKPPPARVPVNAASVGMTCHTASDWAMGTVQSAPPRQRQRAGDLGPLPETPICGVRRPAPTTGPPVHSPSLIDPMRHA